MRTFVSTVAALTLLVCLAAPANALQLTDRQVDVTGTLTVSSAVKLAEKLIEHDTEADAPIYMMVTATRGSAQGVMVIADTIRSLRSPVVAVVLTQVHGAGSAVAMFADRVVMYPSSGLVFTDVEYEGVKKPKPPKKDKPADAKEGDKAEGADKKAEEEPEPEEKLLQEVRKQYLERFWGRLAKRLNTKGAALASRIEAGGFVVTADEAVKQKLAYKVVDKITFLKLPKTKREMKVMVTDKQEETAEPLIERKVRPAPKRKNR